MEGKKQTEAWPLLDGFLGAAPNNALPQTTPRDFIFIILCTLFSCGCIIYHPPPPPSAPKFWVDIDVDFSMHCEGRVHGFHSNSRFYTFSFSGIYKYTIMINRPEILLLFSFFEFLRFSIFTFTEFFLTGINFDRLSLHATTKKN